MKIRNLIDLYLPHLQSARMALPAVLCALGFIAQPASGRLYDNFDTGQNWTLSSNGGGATIGSSELTLSAPARTICTPTATLISSQTQNITSSRQSILIRSHTGSVSNTVFFLWAVDNATANLLEFKIDDTATRMLVAGYYSNNGQDYHYLGSTPYPAGGPDGLYLAIQESGGVTYFEYSSDANSWTTVTSISDPISMTDITFELQHKEYGEASTSSETTVDCFNYKATGAGYHSLEDKEYVSSGTQPDGWQLYTEGFINGNLQGTDFPTNIMDVNGVDSTQHFTDTSIPEPRTNDTGYDFAIISTDNATTHDNEYFNAYRYQNLEYVAAEYWTYHLYFKYAYPQYIVQGLEFPINKYDGTNRLQGAVAWYPEWPDNGSHTGKWSVWGGAAGWVGTGYVQVLQTNWWYELTFTTGLHETNVTYTNFFAGEVGGMSNWVWNHSYAAQGSSHSAATVPAMQIDDNIADTTTANTRKDCYMAEWNIDWQDEKLP